MEAPEDRFALTLQERISADLFDKIQRGAYAPGDKLPSENELMDAYGVSRVTVRAALGMLVDEGMLVKRRGKGTFVRPQQLVESALTSGSFTDTCHEMGLVPKTRIIQMCEVPADASTARLLGTGDEPIIMIRRLRMAGDIPCIVEDDYFPLRFRDLLRGDLENRSIFELLSTAGGHQIGGFEDHFRVAPADAATAGLLGVNEGTALLEVLETVYGTDADDVIYVNRQFIASDRYLYVVRSHKN